MAETTIAIGSKEWFNKTADRVLQGAIDTLFLKLQGVGKTGDGANTSNSASTTQSSLMDKLPYIAGAVALVGIGIILWKR